jgi:myo-inositol-1(or 4)-monophosphatase
MNIRTAKKVAGSIKKVVEENIGQPGADDEVYIGADERPTYRVDDLAEKAALSALAGESVAVLSEEGGLIFLDESPDYLCVLDPLDGSRNAIKGIPFYCCSVALA